MGKVKAWKMDMEETILDCITEAVVSECDHVTELYKKVTDAITDTYIKEHQSDLIEHCDEMERILGQLSLKKVKKPLTYTAECGRIVL